MDAETACIICNWANTVLWPYFGLGALGAAAAAAAAGSFSGGGGDSDDSGGNETVPPVLPYHHTDPWDEEHRRWYEESQREASEEYEREREADRQERADRRRQEFDNRPWSSDPLIDVAESVTIWIQDLLGLDPDNPDGKGTVPGASKA